MALVELYAYEMQSVDAIERMTDVDSSYIGSWIAQIKLILSGEAAVLENTADEAKSAVANDNISDEIYEDAYENSDDDKEQYDESDDESEEYSNEYDEQEAVSSVYQKRHRQHENAVTLFIRRLFPSTFIACQNGNVMDCRMYSCYCTCFCIVCICYSWKE